jgi:hypothetical protein
MWKRPALVSAACVAAVFFALPTNPAVIPLVRSQERPRLASREEELAEKVRSAIDRGVTYLKDQENNTGDWEKNSIHTNFPGGETALAMLALLNSGVPPSDPIIKRGLIYLRGLKPQHTYVVGIQTMVLAAARDPIDRVQIQKNVDWLWDNRVKGGDELLGWDYRGGGQSPDMSITQYALLGLHDAHQYGGAKIEREKWVKVRDLYLRTQNADGGWGYGRGRDDASILTMTTAGLCGLSIVATELNEGREVLLNDGTAKNCGDYKENPARARAEAWITQHFSFKNDRATYYNLYGIERAGRLSGQRFLGNHDWYREGCNFLLREQNRETGAWTNNTQRDASPIVATSFALLFLSKGRTPVLISKFVHGPGDDWNNDRHDVRNLVDYSSKEMFKQTPLAWQIFDTKRTTIENQADLLAVTADLLQSPIVYLNGHKAPELTPNEKKLLKEFVDNGGFIFAEACCGKKEFADGFRELVKELFEDELTPLPAEHPIWRSWAPIAAGDPFKLEGLQQGCKTIVVLSPQDLSCLWESNLRDTPRGQAAFRLGGNIIAYATGMELPKPRLTQMEVASKEAAKPIPRGYLKVGQIKHGGDWQPAPKAMPNLMRYLRERAGLDVSLETQMLLPNKDIDDFKFLYMHGRNEFQIRDDGIENMRATLESGGLLLADACCGKKAFDRSFRAFAAKLFPDQKLERIPLTDDLFSKELNKEAIKSVRCRVETASGAPEKEYRDMPPFLEGIKYNGRWVVIYSKYDLGCALEKRPSSDCLGHDNASALRIAGAAVLYALKR